MAEPLQQADSLDATTFRVPEELRPEDGRNGGVLEVLLVDGAPWFYGQDVGELIGLKNPGNLYQTLPERYRRLIRADRGSGLRAWALISEPGLYRLLMRSHLPSAEAFQSWIAEEVLPTIRRTGSYVLPSTPEALRALAATIEERDAALERAAVAERLALESTEKMASVAPPASAWLDVSASRGSWLLKSVSKLLNRYTGAGRVNRMRELGEAGGKVSIGSVRASMYRLGFADWDPNTKTFTPRREAEVSGMIIIGDPRDIGTCRITPAGVAAIHADLGGSDPLRIAAEDVVDSDVVAGEIV